MFVGGSCILTGRREGRMCLLVGLVYLQVGEKVGCVRWGGLVYLQVGEKVGCVCWWGILYTYR